MNCAGLGKRWRKVYDHGFMRLASISVEILDVRRELMELRLTELPRGWQPIVNSSGRLARVAKVALDPHGASAGKVRFLLGVRNRSL